MIDKETLFKEFEAEKQKDIELSKNPEPREEVFTNRVNFLKSHLDAKKSNPSYYSNLDIDFNNLLKAYTIESPLDSFYKVVFDKTYDEYMFEKQIEEQQDEAEEKYYSIN